jgi:hypothetical protein
MLVRTAFPRSRGADCPAMSVARRADEEGPTRAAASLILSEDA